MDGSSVQSQSQTQSQPPPIEAPVANIPAWRQGYAPVAGAFDEMYSAPGVLRPHWRTLINRLDSFDSAEITRRWEHGRRLIHENGMTYNVYGDPKGMQRPWELDAIPFLIPPQEW